MLSVRAALALLAAVSAALAAPAFAFAAHGPEPWTGGAETVTPLEQRIGAWTTEITERPSAAHCQSPEDWTALGTAHEFDPANVAGLVPYLDSGTADFMLLSPTTCSDADEFLAAPTRIGQKLCQTGTRTKYRTERYRARVWKLVRVRGKVVRRRVLAWRTRRVRVEVPVLETCGTYYTRIDALMTVAHEAMHVRGIASEHVAECLALQLLPVIAGAFGATPAFAYEIGKDYVPVYADEREWAPDYWSADCRDGGPLDLFPERVGWPLPGSPPAAGLPRPSLPETTR